MTFPEFCIRRPVFTTVMSLLLVIIGMVSYTSLPVRQLPDINPPAITINTTYVGASPSIIEAKITTPIENYVSGINGVDYISSTSSNNTSAITITFKLGTNINEVTAIVLTKLSQAQSFLPKDALAPAVSADGAMPKPVIVMLFRDPNKTTMAVTDYVSRYFKTEMSQISGVAKAAFFGEKKYSMRIWLDSEKMAARGVSAAQVVSALQAQSVNIPGGQIKTYDRYYTVNVKSELDNAKQFNDVIISVKNGYITRFSDIAKVVLAPENDDSEVMLNGKETTALYLTARADGNPLTVARDALNILKRAKPNMPEGMTYYIMYNQATFIQASIDEVYKTLIEAIVLVIIVVFLFLGSLRSALIPIVTIPVCLIATFAILSAMGYSIDTISLLAMVLAIGLVVDDAIVMLENIYRYVEDGMPPYQAALVGSKEIVFAVIAMSITLAAVFAPVGFATGIAAKIFREFAFTLAGAVIISGFVALSLSPMMCSRMLPKGGKKSRYSAWLDKTFDRMLNAYKGALRFMLTIRPIIIIILLALIFVGYLLFTMIPSELAPTDDIGYIMGFAQGPTNASYDYMNNQCKAITKIYNQIPEAVSSGMVVGFPAQYNCLSFVKLKPWSERNRSQQEIGNSIGPQMFSIPGIMAFPINPPPLGLDNAGNYTIQFVLMMPGDFKQLDESMDTLMAAAQKSGIFSTIQPSLIMDNIQFEVDVNRSKAYDMKLSMADISSAISTFLGGYKVQQFAYNDRNYYIYAKINKKQLGNPQVFKNIYVKNSDGDMIKLTDVATVKPIISAAQLPHYDTMRSDTFQANLAPGHAMSDAVAFLEQASRTILPAGVTYRWTGSVADYLSTSGSMYITFGLALVFIFLILAAQFESFIDPLIILFSVPLSVVGALFALKVTGNTMNIFSQIGLVTLIGLITKHGILITEFANQQRAKGLNIHDAIVEGAALRLRPILMTTAAMVLGTIPLAIASGAGADNRRPIGWVIIGGMVFGTFFSLIVVPVVYSYLAKFDKQHAEEIDEPSQQSIEDQTK